MRVFLNSNVATWFVFGMNFIYVKNYCIFEILDSVCIE